MPFDAQPTRAPDLNGYLAPKEAAAVTPVGTLREPVLAAVIAAIRDVAQDVSQMVSASPR